MAHFTRMTLCGCCGQSLNKTEGTTLVINNEDITDSEGNEIEEWGEAICQDLTEDPTSVWKQVSYNANGNGFRGNYPGRDWVYMENVTTLGVASTDIFIEPQPHPSWSIGINTATWYPPHWNDFHLSIKGDDDYWPASCLRRWDEDVYQQDNSKGWGFKKPDGRYSPLNWWEREFVKIGISIPINT